MSYLEKLLDGAEVEWKPLGEIAIIGTGSRNTNEAVLDGKFPFFVRSQEPRAINEFEFDETAIITAGDGVGVGKVFHYMSGKYALHQRAYRIVVMDSHVSSKYLFHFIRNNFAQYLKKTSVHASVTSLRMPMFEKYPIPIPCPKNPEKSLAIQEQIVRILDAFTALTAELTARKKQYNYYRDKLLTFSEGEVEWKSLGEVCLSISAGGDLPENYAKDQIDPSDEFPYPIYANATGDKGLYGFTNGYKIESDAVTISARGAKIGYHTVREGKFTPIIRLITLVPNKSIILTKYLNYILDMTPIGGTDGGIPQLTVPTVKKIQIPVPYPNDPKKSLAEQARIVAILDKFDTITNSLQEGLPREIEQRQKQYEYYRDLLLNFPKPKEAVE